MPLLPALVTAAELRVTRTALGGGSDAAIVEELGSQASRRVLGALMRGAQSLGVPEIQLGFRNDDGLIDAWSAGDGLKVEARALKDAAWATLLDGFVGGVEDGVEGGRAVARVTGRGWSALLDLLSLTSELSFEDKAWTTIADSLITSVLGVGFARSITSDSSKAAFIRFPAGMKLREALDIARRALNAGSDKWEHVVEIVGGSKTYRLYKRDATVQRTFEVTDLLPGSGVAGRNINEVVNKAVVAGAVVPSQVEDRTGLARSGSLRPTATSTRIAQPFTALDTPLAGVSFFADRSVTQDPPTLNMDVVRNAQVDPITRGVLEGRQDYILRSVSEYKGARQVVDPLLDQLTPNRAVPASTTEELVAFDLGASPPTINVVKVRNQRGADAQVDVQYSDDDVSWTTALTGTLGAGQTIDAAILGSPQTRRYWRVRGINTGGSPSNIALAYLHLISVKNTGADATTPVGVHFEDPQIGTPTETSVAVTGDMTREAVRIDFGSAVRVTKFNLKHATSLVSASITLQLQRSNDASNWDTVLILDSVSSATDSAFLQETASRYWRVVVVDVRPAASSSSTVTMSNLQLIPNTKGAISPIVGGSLKGGALSWDVTGLVAHPGVVEEKSYPAPRLDLEKNAWHWLVFRVAGAATSKSFWDLDYNVGVSLSSLQGHWSFEERSGTTINDSSANNNDGTVTNASAPGYSWVDGKRGNAFWTDGQAYINVPNLSAYNASSAFSFGAWFYAIDNPAAPQIHMIGGRDTSWYFGQLSTGKLRFSFKSGGVEKQSESSGTLTLNAWNFCWVTYDGSNVRIYLNGDTPDSTTAQTGNMDSTSNPLKLLEASDFTATRNAKGAIADAYLLTRVLSNSEMALVRAMTSNRRVLLSDDSGATYYGAPFDLCLKSKLRYNIMRLIGSAEDAGSQATYASFVPGGVLSASLVDDSLQSQDAVDKEAAALVQRRKSAPRRVRLIVPFDASLSVGKRVRLSVEAGKVLRLGGSVDLDVLQVDHEFGARSVSRLSCDEYPVGSALDAVVAFSTGRAA